MLARDATELGGGCIGNGRRGNNMADGQPASRVFSVGASNQRDSSLGICLVLDTQSFAHRTIKTRFPKHTQNIGVQAELDQ